MHLEASVADLRLNLLGWDVSFLCLFCVFFVSFCVFLCLFVSFCVFFVSFFIDLDKISEN